MRYNPIHGHQHNDINDFIRLLKENPEWLATVRAVILAEELLNLPQQFAEFVAMTSQSFQLVNLRLKNLEEGQEELRGDMGKLHTNHTNVEELQQGQVRLEGNVEELQKG